MSAEETGSRIKTRKYTKGETYRRKDRHRDSKEDTQRE